MQDFRLINTINDIDLHFTSIFDNIELLKKLFVDVDNKLISIGWSGEAYETCVDGNALLIEFLKQITPFCESFKDHAELLSKDSNDFEIESDNVKQLNVW